MLVTITNVSTSQIFLSTHYVTLEAGHSVQVRRTLADLDKDQQLKGLVLASQVTLAFANESTDAVQIGFEKLKEYSNTTRPAANTVSAGTMIWNTSDSAPNFSDGSAQWYDAMGNIT